MKRPTLAIAVAVNRAVREHDEWFDEPDDLHRVQRALAPIEKIDDPVEAAAVLACRLTRAQGFTEGNKRTGLLLARWVWTATMSTAPLFYRQMIGSSPTSW